MRWFAFVRGLRPSHVPIAILNYMESIRCVYWEMTSTWSSSNSTEVSRPNMDTIAADRVLIDIDTFHSAGEGA